MERVLSWCANHKTTLIPAVTCVVLIALWQFSVDCGLIANFLLPTPLQVCHAAVQDCALLCQHAQTTLLEALYGLVFGCILGFVVAVIMDVCVPIRYALSPLITVSQTVPTIAIAPLLVLWLGYGLLPKVVLVILTTFFPITISLTAGFQSVSPDMLNLMKTMGATPFQLFWYVKIPGAIEHAFSGLTISATYAIVAAVIAEWLGGYAGLGVYMIRVRKSFSYDRMFAVIVLISALSLALMGCVRGLQHICMPYKKYERNQHE